MCKECGCESGAGGAVAGVGEPRHPHGADPAHPPGPRQRADRADATLATLELNRPLLEKNDRLAERNRGFFKAKKLLVLNLVSAPGSGKTALIRETALRLRGRLRVGVIVGDLATDNDAARLRTAEIPVVQVTTGTVCHLDAASQLNLDALDVLFIENVGNLVCPADFDLGEDLRVVLLATPEGEDKPLKYPPLFHSAHVVLVTKSDLAAAVEFDRGQALANLKRISHHAEIFELSARTGDGMAAWLTFLEQARARS